MCRSIGDSTRVLKNELTAKILELEKAGIGHDELLALASSHRWVRAANAGDPDDGAFAAGVAVGLIDDIPGCTELVQRIVEDARHIIGERLQNILN